LGPHVGSRLASSGFDGIHEGEGIPLTTREELRSELGIRPEQQFNALHQVREARVLSHAAEPILRVPVVRLAPVHDAVDQAAVWPFDALRENVRGIVVVVPEQQERADEFGLRGYAVAAEQLVERAVQVGLRECAGARRGAERGGAGLGEERVEFGCESGSHVKMNRGLRGWNPSCPSSASSV